MRPGSTLLPAGWRPLVCIYLFKIKIILGVSGSRCGLHYHMSFLPCACSSQQDRSDRWSTKFPIFCPSGISGRSTCPQAQPALRGAEETVQHQKPSWRTYLWVKTSLLCPPPTAGREAAGVPLYGGNRCDPFSCWASAEVSREVSLNMLLWFSLTSFYLIS